MSQGKAKKTKAALLFANQITAPAILDLLAAQQFDAAFKLANRYLAKHPTDADVMLLAGVAAAQAGRVGEAAQQWQHMIALAQQGCVPSSILTQVWFNLGKLCQAQDQAADAAQCYRQALLVDAENTDAREQLALLLAAQGNSDEAINFFQSLSASEEPQSRFHFNLAVLLAKRDETEAAIEQYRQALALAPDYAEAWINLGLLLMQSGDLNAALDCQAKACEVAPNNAIAYSNYGLVLDALNRGDEAESAIRKAVVLAPDSAPAHSNLAVMLVEGGDFVAAENLFRQALSLDPEHVTAIFYLSNLLLAQGRYQEGWPLYEVRFHPKMTERQSILPPVDFPQWQGESLQGKRIMIWPEQGFGDEIQFSRYLALIKARGAREVTLVCRDALAPLMAEVAGVDRVIAVSALRAGIPAYDYWSFSMSLPRFFTREFEDVPAVSLPYLKAPQPKLDYWASRLAESGPLEHLKVGLLWQGNPRHLNDLERSLPGLASLSPLWRVDGVSFVSLQPPVFVEGAAPVPAELPTDLPIIPLGADIKDFADAAAIIMQLDLVITVDSAYAHLAAALGKPCWVLLPARRTDWRWGYERSDSPWYPGVMRLFRQEKTRRWAPLIETLAEELSQFRQALCASRKIG